jgi:hypothetical protein
LGKYYGDYENFRQGSLGIVELMKNNKPCYDEECLNQRKSSM